MQISTFTIRLATDDDFETIYDIWQEGIGSSFNIENVVMNEVKNQFKANFLKRYGVFNYWVLETAGDILGWASLNICTVSPLKINDYAEISLYFKRNNKTGINAYTLVNYVIEQAKVDSSLKYIIAFISSNNKAVKKVADKTGFTILGKLPNNNKDNSNEKLFIVRHC